MNQQQNDKLDYFIAKTDKDLEEIKKRLQQLWDFRSLLIGGSLVVSAVTSLAISAVYVYFGVH